MINLKRPWSYSSMKTFEQCPKKYYHLYVAKDVKDDGNEASRYGTELHKAAELYVKNDTPLPAKFKFMDKILKPLKNTEGEKSCELRLGVALDKGSLSSCDFFSKKVWWRGLADLFINRVSTGLSLDYKTGKNAKYADLKQLDLVAGALFVKYPKLETVKSALVFVASGEFIQKTHYKDKTESYFDSCTLVLDRIDYADSSNKWEPVSGPLCGYCPVTTCRFNERG